MRIETNGCGSNRSLGLTWRSIRSATTVDCLQSKVNKSYSHYPLFYCGTNLKAFNGQEKDDEVSGSGNTMSAEFWEYDARLGRRWNIDPVDYAWQSSYATFNNNPMLYNDPNGLEGEAKGSKGDNPKKVGKVGSFLRDLLHNVMHPFSQHNSWGNTHYKHSRDHNFSGWPSKVVNWIGRLFGQLHEKIPVERWVGNNKWVELIGKSIGNHHYFSLPVNLTNERLWKTKVEANYGTACRGLSKWSLFGNIGETDIPMYGGGHLSFLDWFHGDGISTTNSGIGPRVATLLSGLMLYEIALSGFSYKTALMNPFIAAGLAMGGRINPAFRNTTKFRIDVNSTIDVNVKLFVKVKQWQYADPFFRGPIFRWYYGINK